MSPYSRRNKLNLMILSSKQSQIRPRIEQAKELESLDELPATSETRGQKSTSYTRLLKLKQQNSQEHDESNWLLSYSDMMTLLFGFFVLLMSFSKFDVEKFEKARQETTEYFGGEYKIPFQKFEKELTQEVKSQNLETQVLMKVDEKGIAITFRGALFFDLGSSELRIEAIQLLEKIVPVIKRQSSQFTLMIEGHTDDNPISDSRFPSNWELSAYRATSVLHFFEKSGFPKESLRAIGLGDTQPILPNRTPSGEAIKDNQAQNRRVVIRLVRAQL